MVRLVAAVLMLLSTAAPRGPGVADQEVFVAPDAAPGGDGSRARPFARIEAARDALRGRAGPRGPDGLRTPAPTITLLGGTWRIQQSLRFGPEDDGLVLRSAAGTRARLVGGLVLRQPELRPLEDPELLQRLPSDAARAAVRVVALPGEELSPPVHRGMGTPVVPVGSEVFLDGAALVRARWPDGGFARVGEVLDPGSIPRNRADDIPRDQRETGPERGGTFRAPAASERLERWAGATDAWALGYWFHDWAEEQLPIAAVDAGAGTLTLGRPHRYGLKSGTTFYVTGLLEELDAPGEYHLDRARGWLILWPPGGTRSDGTPGTQDGGQGPAPIEELLVTTLGEPMIHVQGARGLRLEDLTLEGSRGPGILVEDCHAVVIAGCTVQNTGTRGIAIRGTDCEVRDGTLRGTGAAGVTLGGGDRATLTPSRNRVVRCRIHDFGRVYRTYQPGVGLDGVGHLVQGNELAHAPHSAILFGGNEHRILDNEIFDVLRETGDCGAIYGGRDWTMHGTRISGNFLHHLGGTEGRWQNAIYLDDMASGIEVSGNLIWRCHWGMLIGGGRDLIIRDNAFVECDLGLRFDARGVGWMAQHLEDPETSTLHRRLAAMPIQEEPWRSRYPTLRDYLTDRFGRPAGSRVTNNRFFATPFGSVEDRECVEVTGNQVDERVPAWVAETSHDERGARTDAGSTAPAALPDPVRAFLQALD